MSHTHFHHDIHVSVLGKYQISSDNVEKKYSHSHGHGGQNVNKVATKVQLTFQFLHNPLLPKNYQERLLEIFPKGEIHVTCQETRHQHKNLHSRFKCKRGKEDEK